MRTPVWLRWTLLALLGLAIAAGVSVAASHLVSQRIGLASEPLSAGEALAPPPRGESGHSRGDRRPHAPGPATTTAATTTPAPSSTGDSTATGGESPPSEGDGDHDGDDD